MQSFNNASRTENSVKTSLIGGITNILKIAFAFGYRTVFILLLSEVYLGINGLFTNVLQILSLAELGITTAIVYRFYEPISRNDVHYVGMLMNFFGRVYRIIALAILIIGLAIMPLMGYLINNPEEIPSDINLNFVYLLFLANTLSTYIFAYRMTLLTADQRNYIFSIIDLIITVSKYLIQLVVLFVTRDFTITLASGIVVVLIINFVGSMWTTNQYKEVFKVKEMLPKEDQRKIFKDTRACMYHKVGFTVLTGTDNAILTKMVSLAATGIYSNYSLLLTYIQSFLTQILGNFTASVGNAIQNMTNDEYYNLFKKVTFSGLWIASFVSFCTYVVIDDFIMLWLGEKFVLDKFTTIILCIQLYLTISRITNSAFINAAGLFVKDKIRPLIEAMLNLIISVVLTYYLGIAGVFFGTIISAALTVCWREPYILFKFSFDRSVMEYWKVYLEFLTVTVLSAVVVEITKMFIAMNSLSWIMLILEGILSIILINAVFWVLFRKKVEYLYLKSLFETVLIRIKSKI